MFERNAKKGTPTRKALLGAVLVLLLALALTACTAKSSAPADAGSGNAQQSGDSAAATGGDLVIPIAAVTEQASFYPVEVDGVKMEVLAVKAPDGTIRTAFNTCEVCYDSGRGYYKQEGDTLVCQNCGNRFKMSQVEIESGGCNPWPIFDKNKTVTDESITISYDFLKESEKIFSNWKRSY
ncbi:MAG TPA: DUF2318 domain-containing protein [Clostridia bacterium]|nr:DUF2318 domain-containing protein [Clostridia bacterium]